MLNVKNSNESIFRDPINGPIFGCDVHYDLFIKDYSNINTGSYSWLGKSYQRPDGFEPDDDFNMKKFLAGSHNSWLTTEIEVYQLD